ncbi:MAG: SIMPL domain-containing protein [Nanoarchaeota archaeon]
MKEPAWHILLAVLIIGSTLLIMNTEREGGVGYPVAQEDTVSVIGQSDLDVAPDEAELTLSIESEGQTAKEAQDANAGVTDRVMKALQSAGVTKNDVDTTGYYLYKREGYDPKTGKPFPLGYQQTHTMRVLIKDIEKAGDVIDAATNAGVTSLQNIQFTLSKDKEKKSRADALKLAVEHARDKAEILASAVGENLGDAISVSESNYVSSPPMPYYRGLESAAMDKTEVLPEDVTLSLMVTVVFELT